MAQTDINKTGPVLVKKNEASVMNEPISDTKELSEIVPEQSVSNEARVEPSPFELNASLESERRRFLGSVDTSSIANKWRSDRRAS